MTKQEQGCLFCLLYLRMQFQLNCYSGQAFWSFLSLCQRFPSEQCSFYSVMFFALSHLPLQEVFEHQSYLDRCLCSATCSLPECMPHLGHTWRVQPFLFLLWETKQDRTKLPPPALPTETNNVTLFRDVSQANCLRYLCADTKSCSKGSLQASAPIIHVYNFGVCFHKFRT